MTEEKGPASGLENLYAQPPEIIDKEEPPPPNIDLGLKLEEGPFRDRGEIPQDYVAPRIIAAYAKVVLDQVRSSIYVNPWHKCRNYKHFKKEYNGVAEFIEFLKEKGTITSEQYSFYLRELDKQTTPARYFFNAQESIKMFEQATPENFSQLQHAAEVDLEEARQLCDPAIYSLRLKELQKRFDRLQKR